MKFVFDRSMRGWYPGHVAPAQARQLRMASSSYHFIYHDYVDHGSVNDFSWDGECKAVGAARWTKSGVTAELTKTGKKLADEGYEDAKARWPNGISLCPAFGFNLNRLFDHLSQATIASHVLRIPVIDHAYDIEVYAENAVVRFSSPLIAWEHNLVKVK